VYVYNIEQLQLVTGTAGLLFQRRGNAVLAGIVAATVQRQARSATK
jgi:hypothetical protein